MIPPDEPDKLRMAPRETAQEITQRLERQHRAAALERESRLQHSLENFRVGSVPYLNAVPLTRGIEQQTVYATPSRLADMLRNDELDAALVSVTEALLTDRYDILDGIAVASLGEVKSVLLVHRRPLDEAREILCDAASLTSVQLLRVLLAEHGIHPIFSKLPDDSVAPDHDFFLLIGDRAIDFSRASQQHSIWDLGTAWFELTGLPFVYAVWALRRGVENSLLRRQLREAKEFGIETLDQIINTRTDYDLEFRKDYLGWHIHYHLGSDEKRGLAKFAELLRKHGTAPVFEPRFVA